MREWMFTRAKASRVSRESVAEIVHIICVGPQSKLEHTAGLTRYGGKEVLLITAADRTAGEEEMVSTLREFEGSGVGMRIVAAGRTYKEALSLVSGELEGYAQAGACIAINGATGQQGVVHAVYQAALAALSAFHPPSAPNDDGAASAFLYFPISEKGSLAFDIAPIFDVTNARHWDILLALARQSEPCTGRQLHELIDASRSTLRGDKYDNFRRSLYAVRRWLRYVPSFYQEKGDRYRLGLAPLQERGDE